MKMPNGSSAMNLKLTLLLLGAVIAIGTLYYTQNIVNKLQHREKQYVQLYANSLEFVANSENISSDFTFIFQNIIQRIDFPLILTDADDQLTSIITGTGYKNIEIEKGLSEQQVRIILLEKLNELSELHQPIIVKSPDGNVLQKIYYGDSDVIHQLKYYPYLQIISALFFIMIAYTSFNYIKKNEQSNLWVGMSKETAHQLGTPISSLMGWNEILRMHYNNPDKVLDTSEEIYSDLNRLSKITKRFSKIGSQPELNDESPFDIIQRVVNYFERRIPQLGKNVSLTIHGSKESKAKLNAELFEWVIENLIKNALDAIESNNGKIDFIIVPYKKFVDIKVVDNGKGIEYNKWRDIFRPGYSTKRRGWGLGLSLSKRIIENYHKGKIFVDKSLINEGTTFKIVLRASENIS